MQVFITNQDLEIAAMELDDARLRKQISEITEMLSIKLNRICHEDNKVIGHEHHPVYKYHLEENDYKEFLIDYGFKLCEEFEKRFNKNHQGVFTLLGIDYAFGYVDRNAYFQPAYIKGRKGIDQIITTENVYERYRELLTDKWNNDKAEPKWTNRERPTWYKQ